MVEALAGKGVATTAPQAAAVVKAAFMAGDKPGKYWAMQSVMMHRPDVRPVLPRLQVPVLMLAGRDDELLDAAEAERAALSAPDGPLQVDEECILPALRLGKRVRRRTNSGECPGGAEELAHRPSDRRLPPLRHPPGELDLLNRIWERALNDLLADDSSSGRHLLVLTDARGEILWRARRCCGGLTGWSSPKGRTGPKQNARRRDLPECLVSRPCVPAGCPPAGFCR
ncbi:alpha/beta fold hydrolase [Pseudarthrobacter sp. NBSH8]|uniref:alpha/beta fold hydrolase n=1 Tax=Pseudarthrobacter sp. NBSH8 TaxID=2596911 RepID=UPI0021059EEA|nr:hypothetical protein [Pseudarthrobacter sp. NBSH8]